MGLPPMSAPTCGRGEKICSFCLFSLENYFLVRSVRVPMSKRIYKRREATPMYYLAGKGQIIQLCPLPQISSGLTDPDNKKTNTTLKLVVRAGSASRLDSSLLKRGERRALKVYTSV